MMTSRAFKSVSVVSVTSILVLSGCGNQTAGTEGPEEADQRLTLGISDEPGQFAPGEGDFVVTYTLNSLVHAGLVKYDDNADVQMQLAESVDSEDNQVWRIVLRDGVTYANGEPLTAENVADSIRYLSDEDSAGGTHAALVSIETIDVVDESELIITLNEPNTAFLQYLAIPSIAVYHPEDLENDDDSWEGAGPFTVEDYSQGQSITLAKNEEYFDADNVALDEIELVFYPDGTARSNAILSGEVDMVDYVPWEQFEAIEATDDVVLDSQNGPFMYLLFNVAEGSPFADPLLRQAIGYGVNREDTVDSAFHGHGDGLYGVMIDEDDDSHDTAWTEIYEHDMDRARDLIAQSDFDMDEEIVFLTNSQYAFHEDTALPVLSALEDLGFNVRFESPDWATRSDRANAGEYDVLMQGTVGAISDLGYLSQFVSGPNRITKSWDYDNQELGDLIHEGMTATNEESKKAAYDEALQEFTADPPFIKLNNRGQAHAYGSHVEGFSTIPGFQSFYSGYGIENITLSE